MHGKHLIKNFQSLAKSPARRDAFSILEAGILAANPRKCISRVVKLSGRTAVFGRKKINLEKYDHVYVIGVGKAAGEASAELERIFGSRIAGGIALDVKKTKLKRIKSIVGTHPFPSFANLRATGEIMAMLKNLDSRDLVIAVISGGGSALLCWPYELKCDEISDISRVLMKKGATIRELNTVRKHLSEIQGGQFVRLAYPATVVGLIFSDVPGDELEFVASGPTVRDSSTVSDAASVLRKYRVFQFCAISGCNFKETPKDDIFFRKVTNILVGSNRDATEAMASEAKKRGFKPRIVSTETTGEAKDVGRDLARAPRDGEAIIAAGETTVTVKGNGRGGRNQELALSALLHANKNTLVISLASDGIDNSPAAGGIADAIALEAAQRRKLSIKKYLENNDSYSFFKKSEQGIITGITGTNISDLMIALRK